MPSKKKPTEPKELTRAEKKALFRAYEAVCREIAAHEEAIKKLKREKSAAVGVIHEKVGEGPFEWKGEEVLAKHRNGTYYFMRIPVPERREPERIG